MIRAEDIRAAVSIDRLLQIYHYTPNRAGYISCPFHSGDKSPSLRIYPDQDSWHCFGCQRGGTVIDFVMQHEQVDFRQAIRYLAETFGVSGTPINRKQIALSNRRQAQKRKQEQAKAKRINDRLRWLNLRADSLRDRIRSDYEPFSDPVPGGYGEDIAYTYAEYARIDYLRKEVMNE